MKNKLIYKFIIGMAASLLLSFIMISYLGSYLTYRHAIKSTAKSMYAEATNISSNYGSHYYSGYITTENIITQLSIVANYTDSEILLVSSDGYVYMDTGDIGLIKISGFDPTDTGSHSYMISDFYGIYKENHLIVITPVAYNYTIHGYTVITKPVSQIRTESNGFFNYNYFSMLITLVFTSILVIIFVFQVSKPVRKITAASVKYAEGDFTNKIKLSRNDEIGRLADSLDYMASEIGSLQEYQKKFIANISHDFRSPLTSIKGYLEAMLDGTIPPEMQGKYLEIVISETERLTKLTNNLLTMNNITDKGMPLDKCDFDIIGTIKQTINTFEGTCSKKKIKFKLIFCDSVVNVNADQSKIQQVIYNLVDNAIKFSSSDSSIIISVSEKGDKILTSVKDFGIGIPKDSIPKIFDRFYKSDLSRGKDKKGTGLGLSIVKEIISAHQEYIDVISTEGVGTEFIFALPKSKESHNFPLGLDAF